MRKMSSYPLGLTPDGEFALTIANSMTPPARSTFPCPLLIRCLSVCRVSSFTAFWMVSLVTFRSLLHLRIKRKPHSHAPLALLRIDACLLGYVMPRPRFSDV